MRELKKRFCMKNILPKLPTIDFFEGTQALPLSYEVYNDSLTLPIDGSIVHSQVYAPIGAGREATTNAIKIITQPQQYQHRSITLFSFVRTSDEKADILNGSYGFRENDLRLYNDSNPLSSGVSIELNTKYWMYCVPEEYKLYLIKDDKYRKHKLPELENWNVIDSPAGMDPFGGLSYDGRYTQESAFNTPNNLLFDLNDIVVKTHEDSIYEYNGNPTWLLAQQPTIPTMTAKTFNGEIIGDNVKIVTETSPEYTEEEGCYVDTSDCQSGEGITFSSLSAIDLRTVNTCDIMFHFKLMEEPISSTSVIGKYNKESASISKESSTGLYFYDRNLGIKHNSSSAYILMDSNVNNGLDFGELSYLDNNMISYNNHEMWIRKTIVRDPQNRPHVVSWWKGSKDAEWHRSFTTPASFWMNDWRTTTDMSEGGSLQDFAIGNFPVDWGNNTTKVRLYADSYIMVDGVLSWTAFRQAQTRAITFNVTPEGSTIRYALNGGLNRTLPGNVLYVEDGNNVAWAVEKEGYITQTGSFRVTKNDEINVTLVVDDRIKAIYNTSGNLVNIADLTTITGSQFMNTYGKNKTLTGELMPFPTTKVQSRGLWDAFSNNSNLTGVVSFDELTTIEANGIYHAFYNCPNLTGISFPKLVSVGEAGLESSFPATHITTISFPALESIGKNGFTTAFNSCSELAGAIYFPSLVSVGENGFNGTFANCTKITEIHFKSSLSSSTECFATKMKTNARVLFDLP